MYLPLLHLLVKLTTLPLEVPVLLHAEVLDWLVQQLRSLQGSSTESVISRFLVPSIGTPSGPKIGPPKARLLTSIEALAILEEKERKKQQEAEEKEQRKNGKQRGRKNKRNTNGKQTESSRES